MSTSFGVTPLHIAVRVQARRAWRLQPSEILIGRPAGPPTTASIQSGTSAWTATAHKANPEAAGLVLLALALLFDAICWGL
ncbi:MAG: hypothetical protein ACXWNE_11425 [Candidatus Binataceae bacterium]